MLDETLGLITKVSELARKSNSSIEIILVSDVYMEYEKVALPEVQNTYYLPIDSTLKSNYVHIAKMISVIEAKKKPNLIILPSNDFGRVVAPYLSVLTNGGITTDCTEIDILSDGTFLQKRPTFGGKMIATIRTIREPAIATVRPGIYKKKMDGCIFTKSPGELIKVFMKNELKLISRKNIKKGFLSADQEVMFSGGKGLGSKENFNRMVNIAHKLGVMVGASRGCVAAGYAPYQYQIGQTGRIVRPKLYVAFGISGMPQHICGMSKSDMVISVNTDTKAYIKQISDYFINVDANEVLSELSQII